MIKPFTKVHTWWALYQGRWYQVESMEDAGIPAHMKGGGNIFYLKGLNNPVHANDLEQLNIGDPAKTSSVKLAYKRWTKEDEDTLKATMIEGRGNGIPHKELFEGIAKQLDRTPSEVQRKLIRMYKVDPDFEGVKQETWSKEKILDQIKELYASNQPINKNSLPDKLRFTLLKVVPPSAPEHRAYFASVDHALAEAALSCGFARGESGLDYDYPLDSMDDALKYIRLGHKKRHVWSLDEVRDILTALNDADYPITLPFLANHYSIYKSALNVNRKLESFKDVVKKFIDDGSIKSYAELVCSVAPDYTGYYNDDRSRLRLSTEEIRVKKFLDRYKIAYVMPKLSDKLPTGLEKFANFVPDFVIFNNEKKPSAIVEVFGSIGDRENAGVKDIYDEKTQAKIAFYKSIPDVKFIDVFNNNGRCDLDDDSLFARFGGFVKFADENFDVGDLITSSFQESQKNIQKYGCSILYNPDHSPKYKLVSAGQNLEFDSLFELPKLTPKNKALKSIIDRIIQKQKYRWREPNEQRDYAPREVPKDYEAKRDHIYEDVRFR